MSDLKTAIDILTKLVSFDTTSRDSNLALIDWVENYLAPFASQMRRIPNEDGTKANFWARIGPDVAGGMVLSGHSDVVPVDGQPWSTDPFTLTSTDGKLYGRGSCDMKGFLALALAFAPKMAQSDLKRPFFIAISYDEETGCDGVQSMIQDLAALENPPSMCWVGEPTLWKVVSGHKGICVYEVRVTGREMHSSLPHLGASAIHEALDILQTLRQTANWLEQTAPSESLFDPPHATLTIGVLNGGTASNIIARECVFEFDLRCPPSVDAKTTLIPFFEKVEEVDKRLKSFHSSCGVEVIEHADAPPLGAEEDGVLEQMARAITGDNEMRMVGYCAEAGQFQQVGMSTIICGPGSIEQAHQPDEYVATSEIEKGLTILQKVLNTMM
ncbi:acetylornithine deacetylase [Hirschia litorea]|uniref:Acetylornithine deacetylase n=1 Tax=Hirschia litorea TaxID=1199156 RepID=A0ABW2IKX1_9PROT